MIQPTHVDLAFPVGGRLLSRDHGHPLYGALSRALPGVHGARWLGIQAINGHLVDSETLELQPNSRLRLRAPVERIHMLLALAGATIEVNGRHLQLGPPSVQPLRPAATLDAQLVVIRLTRGVTAPFDRAAFDQRFAAEANRQLAKIGVTGEITLRGRRSIQVGGHRIIGHAVGMTGLSADDSIRLQIHGIGGKRTMGCGLFRPARGGIPVALTANAAS